MSHTHTTHTHTHSHTREDSNFFGSDMLLCPMSAYPNATSMDIGNSRVSYLDFTTHSSQRSITEMFLLLILFVMLICMKNEKETDSAEVLKHAFE